MTGYRIRKFKDSLALFSGAAAVLIALIPLASILFEVIKLGLPALNLEFLTRGPGVIGEPGGGVANAIQGTLILIGLSCLIGGPLGLLSGIYLSEFGSSRLGGIIRSLNDVLAGIPSIVVGIFAYTIVILPLGSYSAIGGAVALSVIMLPIVTRTTEEALKLVPNAIREGAMALGIRRWRATVSVVVSSAKTGIVTGIMLAIARVAGETAPLIATILGSEYFFGGLNQPMDALSLRIWRLAQLPYPYAIQQGWGGALVLILLALGLNIIVRTITRSKYAYR